MRTSDELTALTARLEQLLAMLDPLRRAGDHQAGLFADGVRRRLDDLRSIGVQSDRMRLIGRLLDVVPTTKDADAVGFVLTQHPGLAALRNGIEAAAARLAKPLIDAL